MNTLIAYMSTTGYARSCAETIHQALGGGDLVDLAKGKANPDDYERIVVGAPVRAGSIPRKASVFLSRLATLPKTKKIGVFLCGLDVENPHASLEKNIPPALFERATIVHAGGLYDPAKVNVFLRAIMKGITKSDALVDRRQLKELDTLVEHLR